MNPDTKVTSDQLKAICARHKIPYRSHQRITTGFSHEVHRLNDDLVIKLFNTDDQGKFKTEAAVLASDLPFLKPRLTAKNEKDDETGRSYVIMTYVPGMSLGSNWHRATEAQREQLIKDICRSLKVINQISPKDIALEAKDSWDASVKKHIESLVIKLQHKDAIDAQTAEKVRATLGKNLHALANSELHPVYWDIHFDNFIVNDNFELQAIIDLENVEPTSLDYPLFVIQKQTDEPEKFLREEDEKYADRKDYAQLKAWYEKYYPEMFAFKHLDERMKLYQLWDTLHLLVDWSHVQELYEKLDRLTA
ncbi:MAG TPA: aminoglycoside phosphotransferase family protein [Candidatus Limnocylindria bacterium]|nr:aminoglycoside phosphotransferase family protein [Candidatus Limnocylindria bacterium]